MKKSLYIALAICFLLLVGCGTVEGTGGATSTHARHTTLTVTTSSSQIDCGVLKARRASTSLQIQKASAQLTASAKLGDLHAGRQAEQTLIRLHLVLGQEQAWLKACPTSR